MKRLAAVLLCVALPAAAEEGKGFALGEVLNHVLSVCLEKSDALEIVNADVEKGFEAAKALWETKEACAVVPVDGLMVGNVVHSASVVRDNKKTTMRVVEIKDAKGTVMGYFLSSRPLVATLEVVPPPPAKKQIPPLKKEIDG